MIMGEWTLLETLEAGAYIAIMLAVAGVPQMLSSYFDIRARRHDQAVAEINAERRHREERAAEERHHQEAESRRREEAELRRREESERRREERAEAERRREESERQRREERAEAERRYEESERRREESDRRHQEMMLMLAASIGNGNGNGRSNGRSHEQDDILRTMQGVIDDLRAENAKLRGEHSGVNGDQ